MIAALESSGMVVAARGGLVPGDSYEYVRFHDTDCMVILRTGEFAGVIPGDVWSIEIR